MARQGWFVGWWFVVFALCAGCTTTGATQQSPPPQDAARVVLAIDGMTCQGCVMRVTTALKQVKGVYACNVSLKPPRARVVYNARVVQVKAMIARVNGLGYKAMIHRTPSGASAAAHSLR